jgi:hypothetical protein
LDRLGVLGGETEFFSTLLEADLYWSG